MATNQLNTCDDAKIFLIYARANRSCTPNAHRIYSRVDRKIRFRPPPGAIEPGEEITVSRSTPRAFDSQSLTQAQVNYSNFEIILLTSKSARPTSHLSYLTSRACIFSALASTPAERPLRCPAHYNQAPFCQDQRPRPSRRTIAQARTPKGDA